MISFKEKKNNYISTTITLFIFLFLYIRNPISFENQDIYIFDILRIFPLTFIEIFFYVFIPSLTFFVLQYILLKYLNFLWATTISVVSIVSYAAYDFKKFLFDLVFNFDNLEALSQKKIILLEYPNISFSLLLFLSITLFCLNINKFKFYQISILTFLWSCFSFLSFSGSIIGFIFWMIYSSIRVLRLSSNLTKSFYVLIYNLIFYFIFIYLFKDFLSLEGYAVENIYKFSLSYFILYFFIPIFLIFCLYFFYKIDFYELFVKFLPIYALMISDITVSLYLLKYEINYLSFEYFVYPHFFLHFLYVIPIIYYLSKPLSPFILNKKNNLNTIKQGIFIFFNNWSKFYLSLILILLIIFLITPMEF